MTRQAKRGPMRKFRENRHARAATAPRLTILVCNSIYFGGFGQKISSPFAASERVQFRERCRPVSEQLIMRGASLLSGESGAKRRRGDILISGGRIIPIDKGLRAGGARAGYAKAFRPNCAVPPVRGNGRNTNLSEKKARILTPRGPSARLSPGILSACRQTNRSCDDRYAS